ncbi:hypothetical protein [Flavobacterium frigoris]|uniref:DUF4935 domain-containing protein n=1 Tax=Flavobacterium frigoris TaxID=229204 RepID=A0A1H9MW50_FLAFI|nr:hypothetical protein [Flavobacterium frigoris]SER27699.1 hypothetical protein SAMN05444355_10936 [Flavobacterium frigoris]
MIAYLDTCTILNLLQINYDDEYIKYLIKSFDEIKLTPIVFEELVTNKFVNVLDDSHKEILDNIIFQQLQSYIDREDYSDSLYFTKKRNNNCFKENGESHSVSYSIKLSRYGKNDFGENLLKTHFISDDSPAKKDFDHFYQINVIGQILNSIDLMTIFWLKQYITKNQLIKYCHSLKQLYSKDVGILLAKLRDYSNKFVDALKSKQKIIITQLIEILSDLKEDINDKLSEIISDPDFKDVLRKNRDWKELLTNIQKSNFREKIPYINKRMEDLEKVWELV